MKYNQQQAMERNITFMCDETRTGVLIRIVGFGPLTLPGVDRLETFSFPGDIRKFCDLLYDFYDEPQETKAFVEFCAKGTEWSFRNQYPLASEVDGGWISGMTTWMPGHLRAGQSCRI